MTAFLIGSAKGSPGATTTTIALAARWPAHRDPIVLEADPSGGSIFARFRGLDGTGLRDTPSTVQLAAVTRSGLTQRDLLEHLQRLPGPGEVRVLIAPSSPFGASTALAALISAGLGEQLRHVERSDVLVDVGRVDATSRTLGLMREIGKLLIVARPTLESVLHTRDLVAALSGQGVACSLLLVGEHPYRPDEVADAVGTDLVGVIPDDPIGARALAGDAKSTRVLERSRLVSVAETIAARLVPPPPLPPPVSSGSLADASHRPSEAGPTTERVSP